MANANPQRDQFTVAIQCPKCGQSGTALWEENHSLSANGPQSVLVRISDEFYERLGKKAPYAIELVCHRCEWVQPEQ